jgi:hypothetical protein
MPDNMKQRNNSKIRVRGIDFSFENTKVGIDGQYRGQGSLDIQIWDGFGILALAAEILSRQPSMIAFPGPFASHKMILCTADPSCFITLDINHTCF